MKTEKYFQPKENFGINLEYCGVEYCEPSFVMPTHSRDVHLIHYIFKGEGIFTLRDEEHHLSARDMFAIFPQEFTSYRANPLNPFCFCWVGFSGVSAARMLERAGVSVKNPVCSLPRADTLPDLVRELVNLCDSEHSYAEVEIQSLMYRIFHTIEACRESTSAATPNGSAAWEHVQNAKSYIRFNYMNGITVGQIAQQVNLERTYFSKIFHQMEGTSPQEYLLNYRIEAACRLLRDSHYNVKEIGSMAGIGDAYYFSRAFKKVTGLSPSQYRLQQRKRG